MKTVYAIAYTNDLYAIAYNNEPYRTGYLGEVVVAETLPSYDYDHLMVFDFGKFEDEINDQQYF